MRFIASFLMTIAGVVTAIAGLYLDDSNLILYAFFTCYLAENMRKQYFEDYPTTKKRKGKNA